MAWQVNRNGMTAFSVARSMNKMGRFGKEGGKWTATSVSRVIGNRFHRERGSTEPRIGGARSHGIGEFQSRIKETRR